MASTPFEEEKERSMFQSTMKTVTVLTAVLLVAGAGTAALGATVSFQWIPTTQTVNDGDPVGVELWAFPSEAVDFNSAQAVIQWDPTYLALTGVSDPAYPPPPDTSLWSSSFPYGDSFGLNETNPLPTDGDGLWLGEVAPGETLPLDVEGLRLTTVLFQALAETPGTNVETLVSKQLSGRPTAFSKFNVGTSNVLNDVGTPAVITIVPEPASLLACLTAALLVLRRR